MIKCPHCQKKTLPEFKINISTPGKIFSCSSCHKHSKTPSWDFMGKMFIVLGWIIASMTMPLMVVSSYLPFIVIGFKLFSLSFFEMIPLKTTDKNFVVEEMKIPFLKIALSLGILSIIGYSVSLLSRLNDISAENHIVNAKENRYIDLSNAVINNYSQTRYSYSSLDPNTITKDRDNTYLSLAIVNDNEEAIEAFLEKYIDVKLRLNGETSLIVALRYNRIALADILEAKGAEFDAEKEIEYFSKFKMHKTLGWLAKHEKVYSQREGLIKILKDLRPEGRDYVIKQVTQAIQSKKIMTVQEKALLTKLKKIQRYTRKDAQDLIIKGYLLSDINSLRGAAKIYITWQKYTKAASLYEDIYNQGHYQIAQKIAGLYIKGEDFKSAELWCYKAYKHGNKVPLSKLEKKYTAKKLYNRSIKLYTYMYEQGEKQFAEQVGLVYEEHMHDHAKAVLWYKKLGKYNKAKMLYHLGHIELYTKNNKIKAKQYFLRAFKLGSADAAIRLVKDFPKESIIDMVEVDAKLAHTMGNKLDDNLKEYLRWHKKAASFHNAKAGQESAFLLGIYYNKKKKFTKAISFFKKAADYSEAYRAIGFIYKEQLNDPKKSISWFKKDYENGGKFGANDLGNIYIRSVVNLDEADKWLRKSILRMPRLTVDSYFELYQAYKDKRKKSICVAMVISQISPNVKDVSSGYSKSTVMYIFKKKWKLSDEEIKKAYALQCSMKLKKHYEGDIFDYET